MEVWDAYKKDGTLAGCDLKREEKIPLGLFHAVSEVLVKHIDGTYLLMQRDYDKQGYAGYYEATAGGSILKGENPLQGAMRELEEETGLSEDDLTFVFACSDMEQTIYYGYTCTVKCAKDCIILQKGENIGYKWLSKEEFMQFIETEQFVPTQKERWSPYYAKI